MLLPSLIAVLSGGLLLEVIANPISLGHVEPRAKREVPASHSLHERHLDHWSTYWSKRSRVPATQILPMRIGLKQSNLEAGHEKLMDM